MWPFRKEKVWTKEDQEALEKRLDEENQVEFSAYAENPLVKEVRAYKSGAYLLKFRNKDDLYQYLAEDRFGCGGHIGSHSVVKDAEDLTLILKQAEGT